MFEKFLKKVSVVPKEFFLFGLLVLVGFALYSPVIDAPFIHDDRFFILENPNVQDFDLKRVFNQNLDFGLGQFQVNKYYRPFLEIIYWVEYSLFGDNPSGYHLVNIFIHIFNSFWVLMIFSIIFQKFRRPLMGKVLSIDLAFYLALFFLVHPVQTQAVACISGISNLVFAFFLLESFYFYLLSKELKGFWQKAWFLKSLSSFFIALLAKEQAIVLPLLIFSYEWMLSRQTALKTQKFYRSRWFVVPIIYSSVVLGFIVLRKLFSNVTSIQLSDVFNAEFLLRVLTIPKTLVINLGLIVWPKDLHYFRSVDFLSSTIGETFILIVLVILTALLFRIISSSTKILFWFGLMWFLFTQLLTLNIIPLVIEYSYLSAAEHFMYLPMIGIFIIVLALLLELQKKYFSDFKKVFPLIVYSVVLVFMFLSYKQVQYWTSEVKLFERAVQYESELGRVWILLSKAYAAQGNLEQAIQALENAQDRKEVYLRHSATEESKYLYQMFLRDIHYDLGSYQMNSGQTDLSQTNFEKALHYWPKDPHAMNNLGVLFAQKNQLPKALEYFEKSFAHEPTQVFGTRNYIHTLLMLNQQEKAGKVLNQIQQNHPNHPILKEFQ